ncbi:MAG: RebB like protein [Lysobacter sp.]|nr:RebB like protein [Lysobacter sp.]
MVCGIVASVDAQARAAAETAGLHASAAAASVESQSEPVPPAQFIATLYQVASHSAGLSLQNAVHSQQALNQISTAVVSKAVGLIMTVGE